jgi:hypothetical protein
MFKRKINQYWMGILFAVLIYPVSTVAQRISSPLSSFYLASACSDYETNDKARGFCDGAIEAIYSVMDQWCVPPSVTHGQIKTFVREGIRLREKRNELFASPQAETSIPADQLVFAIIREAWPCK